MNLESLRRRRAKRLGVKVAAHTGQRRIFFVLDRATKKFHGDVALWMQYIEYARKQKAHKKLHQVITDVLRLHPTRPELWIYAASYAMGTEGDMMEARSYLQRGLRFCKRSKDLWIEYAKLEMIYIAKIVGRRRILGLDETRTQIPQATMDDDPNADVVALPTVTAEDINPDVAQDDLVDQVALQNLNSTPALSGAIPIAVFDAAMKQFPEDAPLGERFFNMIVGFEGVPCYKSILDHIVNTLMAAMPTNPLVAYCYIWQPVAGVKATSPEFPRGLGVALDRLDSSAQRVQPRFPLLKRTIDWLLSSLGFQELDSDIRKVLLITLKSTLGQIQIDLEHKTGENGDEAAELLEKLQSHSLYTFMEPTMVWALRIWGENPRLLALHGSSAVLA